MILPLTAALLTLYGVWRVNRMEYRGQDILLVAQVLWAVHGLLEGVWPLVVQSVALGGLAGVAAVRWRLRASEETVGGPLR